MAKDVSSPADVRPFVEASLKKIPLDQKRKRQVAFYGGSFTAISTEDQILYLKAVQPFLFAGTIDSVRVSTRPDALDSPALLALKEYGVRTVELGVQSMIDEVLQLSDRGHTAEDAVSAVSRLKDQGFEAGIHLMMGLPGDSLERFLESLEKVIQLRPDFVRIHPTLVLQGAPLEALWRKGSYFPLNLDEALFWLKRGLLKLERAAIPLVRVGLQITRELGACYLAGPLHPSLHQLVDSEIYFDMAVGLLKTHLDNPEPVFFCHPGEVSNVRGQKNGNIQRLKEHFGVKRISVLERENISNGSLVLQTARKEALISRGDLQYD